MMTRDCLVSTEQAIAHDPEFHIVGGKNNLHSTLCSSLSVAVPQICVTVLRPGHSWQCQQQAVCVR